MANGFTAVAGRDVAADAFFQVAGNREVTAIGVFALVGIHGREIESVGDVLADGCADESASFFGEEVDNFRCDFFGGDDEITFVFTVFIIDDDDGFTTFDVANGLGNGVEHLDKDYSSTGSEPAFRCAELRGIKQIEVAAF